MHITAWKLLCYCLGHLRVLPRASTCTASGIYVYCLGNLHVLPRASTCTASGIYVYCLGHLRVLPRESTCTASGIYVYCLGHLRVLPRASTCTASGIYVYCLRHLLAACVLSGSSQTSLIPERGTLYLYKLYGSEPPCEFICWRVITFSDLEFPRFQTCSDIFLISHTCMHTACTQ